MNGENETVDAVNGNNHTYLPDGFNLLQIAKAVVDGVLEHPVQTASFSIMAICLVGIFILGVHDRKRKKGSDDGVGQPER
jgi:hypothetical protein